jgi:imidazolonepropionase-like amidohydrolase
MHVIQDTCVIPIEGAERLPHHDVVVEGATIEAVLPTGGTYAEGTTIVDGRERFAIPGLIDTHVHLWDPINYMDAEGVTLDELNATWLELCLLSGVTTVLCLSGSPELLAVRDQVAAGERDGPTIHSAGPILNDATMTYEQARAEVAQEVALGYEFVKVYNELTADAYRGIMDEAREHGMRVLGHVTRAPGFAGVVASDQMAIVHAEEMLYTAYEFGAGRQEYDWARAAPLRVEELPRHCAAIAGAGMTVMPVVSAFYAIWQQSEDVAGWLRQLPDADCVAAPLRERWLDPAHNDYLARFASPWARRNLLEGFWFQMREIEELHRAGATLTAGTDFPIPGTVPGLLHLELSLLAVAGLGNAGALHAATRAGGELLEPGTQLGAIVPGARADLVLLDADPLEDVRNAKRIDGVMARGAWHDRAQLDARRRALRTAAG